MSHTKKMTTCIRDLRIAALAAQALGLHVSDLNTVKGYFAEGNAPHNKRHTLTAMTITRKHLASQTAKMPDGTEYRYSDESSAQVGLRPGADGNYELVFDAWGISLAGQSHYEQQEHDGQMRNVRIPVNDPFANKFGDTFGAWYMVGSGHVSCGYPNLFLQEYARQFGLDYAARNFMGVTEEVDAATGDKTLILTGGNLMPGESIRLICRRDGSSTMAAGGFHGDRCMIATKPLEDALGVIWDTELTGDYYHDAQDFDRHLA